MPRLVCVIAAVVVLGVTPRARQQEAQARDPGLYVVQADASVARLVPQLVDVAMKGLGTSMLTGGFSRPSAEARLFGTHADTRLPLGRTTFHLQLNAAVSGRDLMAYSAVAASDIPIQVRRPNDIALVRLTVAENSGERVADLGRIGGTSPKNKVDMNTTRLDERAYRLETKTPLVAGEYAFTVLPVSGGSGVASEFWAFGIDP